MSRTSRVTIPGQPKALDDSDRSSLLAQILMQQAMQPVQYRQGDPPAVAFQPAIAALGALFANKRANRNEADKAQRIAQMLTEATSPVTETTPGTPEQVMPEGVLGPPQPGTPDVTTQRPRTLDETIAALGQTREGQPLAQQALLFKLQQQMAPKEKAVWNVEERYNEKTGMKEKVLINKNDPTQILPFGGQQSEKDRQSGDKPIVVTGADGSVRLVDNNGNLIRDLGVVGKPTSTYEKNVIAQKKMKQDLDAVIPNLEALSKDGGLLDQATGSGAGKLVDIGASFFGKATPGAIAIGKLQPLVDPILKLVPRFEGPQSDKDTTLYKEAAGNLANPNVPNEIKKAAAKEILRIYKARRSQFTTTDYESTSTGPAQGGLSSDEAKELEQLRKELNQ